MARSETASSRAPPGSWSCGPDRYGWSRCFKTMPQVVSKGAAPTLRATVGYRDRSAIAGGDTIAPPG
jgi:hypothetical protein